MRGKLGYARQPDFCIAWRDEFSNELGFRITLTYISGDEEFVYQVGPDVTDFFFPQPDWPDVLPPPETPCPSCSIKRKGFSIFVNALLPTGEVLVDGFAIQFM